MNSYLKNITPDSFSGIIFALEGIQRSIVLINGPTGCKFYHSATSDNQTIKQFEFDPLNYPEKWYFGQPRVPCTYLDSGDYIYGSKDKLIEALEFIKDNVPFDIICIVNSPGAALIGDDLSGIAKKILKDKMVLTIQTPGYSSDICSGYVTGALELLRQISFPYNNTNDEPEKIQKGTVNILGLSIFHKYYAGDIEELRRIMKLCDIDVNCVLCAESDIESIKNIGNAELNIVIHPEYGVDVAKYLKETHDTPYYVCDGPPIGFSATEKMMLDISAMLGKDASGFLVESERARGRVYKHISRVNSLTGLPKGVQFALEGTYSEIYSYCNFLTKYFGMIVECCSVLNEKCDCYKKNLIILLTDLGLEKSLDKDIMTTNAQMIFGNGNTIAGLKLRKHEFVGIETCLPTLGYIDITPKTHLGIKGALFLTEQVLNALIF